VPYLGVPVVAFVGFSVALLMSAVLLLVIFRSERL
jgi:hypothetical protein